MLYYRLDHAEDMDKLTTYLLGKLPDMPDTETEQTGTKLPAINPRAKENWKELLPAQKGDFEQAANELYEEDFEDFRITKLGEKQIPDYKLSQPVKVLQERDLRDKLRKSPSFQTELSQALNKLESDPKYRRKIYDTLSQASLRHGQTSHSDNLANAEKIARNLESQNLRTL